MSIPRRLTAFLCALCLLPMFAAAVASSTAEASAPPADESLFAPLDGFELGRSDDVRVRPSAFHASRADLDGLQDALRGGGTRQVTIPDPAGTPTTFHVVEHSVMEPELQAAHPEIRTYRGADALGSSITLDITPMGFHAFVRRPDGVTWLVDPAYNRPGEDRVLSYAGHSAKATSTFVERELDKAVAAVAPAADGDFSTPGGIVSKRTYRIAFLTDNTYATYFPGNVFAEKTTMMARVNEVYNDDLAIEFVLITGTDTKLNFDTVAKMTGINGPCGQNACFTAAQVDNCGGDTLTRNVFVLGQVMGADNFDIGHIGLGNAGGGIAGLGVVGDSNKARGCTGLPTPDGDLYAIDYVAHEVGHQMGGNHTFNSSVCAGNRNPGTSVEPGSGSSVMAYAGICGTDDLQPHSDPYFSQRSVDEIEAITAAAPSSFSERQSVAFTGLDVGEQMSITCASCASTMVTWDASAVTNTTNLIAAITTATGSAPTLTQYDGTSPTISATGFTANWAALTNIPTLVVTPVAGFTALVGTITNGGPETNGGVVSVSTNSSPTITGAADKTIPARTPFALTATAADIDGDTLTYMWEQNDAGSAAESLTTNSKTAGPLFHQFGIFAPVTGAGTLTYNSPGENLAGLSPTRTFPDIAQIVAGNTNAATGSCPAAPGSPPVPQATVECYSEFLPTSGWVGALPTRALNFRLSVRDEFTPDGPADDPGGLTQDDVVVTVDKAAGPFLVTSRAAAGAGSGFEPVTWDVAGTNTAAMATNVKISLSTDGGLTYPTVLEASTANDGAHTVILPNITTSTARIKVEAVGNYFFDINDTNFSISPAGGNLTPIVDAGPDATVAAGSPFVSAGSFLDETPGTATATVDYGDGAGPQPLPLTGSTFALSHTYATAGAKTVTVKVTDSGALFGTDTATVTVTAGPPPPVLSVTAGTVTIKGKTIVGKKLKAKVAGWSPDGLTYSYEWLRNGKVIKKATAKKYTLTNKDKGKKIRVRVTGSKPGYTSGVAISKKTGKIQDA